MNLNEHDNVIDLVRFAPPESAQTIQNSEYYKSTFGIPLENGKADEESGDSEMKANNGEVPQEEEKQMTYKEKMAKAKADLALKRKKIAAQKELEESKEPQQQVMNEFIASASRDKTLKIWDVKSGKCIVTLAGHDNWVTGLVFHPNGRFLLSVSDDKSIRIWDLNNGRCYRKLKDAHDHFINTISMKQKTVVTAGVDMVAKVWQCL